MRRVMLLMFLMAGCLDDFDRFFVVDGGTGATCNDCAGGSCHDGACCRGCWDGTTCQSGADVTACGVNGGACQLCNDHNECTADKCTNGVCGADNLNSGEPCNGGICDMGQCSCGAQGQPCCPQGATCTGGLACQNGHCGNCGATGTACCPTGTPCAAGRICNAASNMCEQCGGNGQLCCAGQSCSSGLVCGADGHCAACGGTSQPCCVQGNPCQNNLSCGSGGICECGGAGEACCGGTSCTDDANLCNGTETCQGVCVHVGAVTCTALDQCHDIGTCDAATGTCSNPAKADGTTCSDDSMCTVSDTCQSGVCQSGAPLQCSGGQHCIASSGCVCDGTSCGGGCCASNQCQAGTADNACGTGGNSCVGCGTNQICQGQSCVACGGPGQPCCHGSSACGSNLVCDAASTCQPCGLPGELCCAGSMCQQTLGVCSSGSVCISKDVWAVGASGSTGLLAHYDGNTWSTTTVANTTSLNGIWGSATNDVFAAGTGPGGGIMTHWTGGPTSTPSVATYVSGGVLNGIFGLGSGLSGTHWLAGQDSMSHGVVVQPDTFPATVVTISNSTTMRAVGASSSADMWAVGINGISNGVAAHFANWPAAPTQPTVPMSYEVHGVVSFGVNDAWAVGATVNGVTGQYDGLASHWNGTAWTSVQVPGSHTLYGVWAASPTDVWAVGIGVLVRWPNGFSSSPIMITSGLPATVRDLGIWGSGPGDVWIVGGPLAQHCNGIGSATPNCAGATTVLSGANLHGVWGVAR